MASLLLVFFRGFCLAFSFSFQGWLTGSRDPCSLGLWIFGHMMTRFMTALYEIKDC